MLFFLSCLWIPTSAPETIITLSIFYILHDDGLDRLLEQVLNSTWLNKKYAEVEVTQDYLMNIIAFQSHQRKEGMKLYTK